MSNEQKEKTLLEYMIANPVAYSICKNIMKPDFFIKEHSSVIKYLSEYTSEYNDLPSVKQIKSQTGIDFDVPEDASRKLEWVCDQLEKHCRLHATIAAITDATDDIMNENYAGVVDPIKRAVLLSLHRDLGTDYSLNPLARLRAMAMNDLQPTGFKDLDEALFGGTMLGGVNFVAANSGGGKSFFLANIAMNWIERGKNVVYITLELSESFVCKRFDQMVSDMTAQDVMRKMEEVDQKVKSYRKRTGKLIVKYFSPQSRVQEIEAYLKELELKTGEKFDLVCLDYLDLLMPNNENININDHFTKDKLVTEQIRTVMGEGEYHCWTASQLNREAVNSLAEGSGEHNHSHISGGISKINTADTVGTLAMNTSLKEHCIIRFQFIKTRTSSGVGKIIPIGFNNDTMRMFDATDEQKDWFYSKDSSRNKKAIRPAIRLPKSNTSDKLDAVKARLANRNKDHGS